MSSISSPVSADSASDSSAQGCERSRSVSEMNTAGQSCESTGPTFPASKTYTPLTQSDWVGSLPLISSAAAFPVSHSVSPASSELRPTTATSGRKCAELLHSRDPLGSLLKTLLVSSHWHSTMCWLTWKASATPQGRLLFRLSPSMRVTDGIACGSLLATATATANQLAPSMQKWKSCAALLPTPTAPRANDSDNTAGKFYQTKRQFDLAAAVQLLPTPTATPYGTNQSASDGAAVRPSLGTLAGGSLNPTWVEWLMGFPEGWTALEPSEMPSSRRSRKSSGGQS
jgi:hypothetical protein